MKCVGIAKLFSIFVLGVVNQCDYAFSYKVLAVFPMYSRSPFLVGKELMRGLAADGHEVTVISPFEANEKIANYTEIYLDGIMDGVLRKLPSVGEEKFQSWEMFYYYFHYGSMYTQLTMSHPKFQQLLRSDAEFDVVIISFFLADALLGLGHHFNAPVIAFCPFGPTQWHSNMVGVPTYPSYMPIVPLDCPDKMSFTQRASNLWYYWMQELLTALFKDPKHSTLLQQYYPRKDMPSLDQLQSNVALVLLSSHVTFSFSRPNAPNTIEVGGLHINETVTPLPPALKNFMDEADQGVIFFSLGSLLPFSSFSAKKKLAVLNTFKKYPKMRLILKSDERVTIPSHNAEDVFISNWLPQHSVLSHPKLKLFVTHGGVSSILEAIHFGKPVIGVPVFGDQHFNIGSVSHSGIAEAVPYAQLNEENLMRAFDKVLTDPSYARNARIMSDRFRDRIVSPLRTAVHWIKHVAKNKGAPHLRSAAIDMPFYAYYNLDVYLVLISLLILSMKIAKWFCRRTLRLLFRKADRENKLKLQ